MDYPVNESTRELQTPNRQGSDSISQTEIAEELIVPVLREELNVHKELRKTGTVRVH